MHVSPLIDIGLALAAHDIEPETAKKIVADLASKAGCDCTGCAVAKLGDEPVPARLVAALNDRLSEKIEEVNDRIERVHDRLDEAEDGNTSNTISIIYLSIGGIVLAWTFIAFAEEITAAQRRLFAAIKG